MTFTKQALRKEVESLTEKVQLLENANESLQEEHQLAFASKEESFLENERRHDAIRKISRLFVQLKRAKQAKELYRAF